MSCRIPLAPRAAAVRKVPREPWLPGLAVARAERLAVGQQIDESWMAVFPFDCLLVDDLIMRARTMRPAISEQTLQGRKRRKILAGFIEKCSTDHP